MIRVECLGAAREVTGSMHLVHTPKARILLEAGLFQGRRRESVQRNRDLGVNPRDVTAVVLSHAHIDHSGSLPRLLKHGYEGNIYMTPATRDLCTVMLEDGAMIQANDAAYIQRRIERDGIDMEPVEPLYDMDDVIRTLQQTLSVPYHRRQTIAPGVELTFLDAGHVLGSAIVVLDIDDEGENRRLVFTGDLGRRGMPILRDPEVPDGTHLLITESTYGDRSHGPIEALDEDLAVIIKRTVKRGGKLIIPSFALERAQEIVYACKRLSNAGKLPAIPVYVDSPLTVKITDVFRMHPECYDDATRELMLAHNSPFDFEGLKYVSTLEESKLISTQEGPAVIISASGMAEYGRVLHHLKATIEDERNGVLIVGFQAQHTLGRRLVEGRSRVRIFGVERDRRARVDVLAGFSAHADREDLLDYAERVRARGKLRQVIIVHGEKAAQDSLQAELDRRKFPRVAVPERGDIIEL